MSHSNPVALRGEETEDIYVGYSVLVALIADALTFSRLKFNRIGLDR